MVILLGKTNAISINVLPSLSTIMMVIEEMMWQKDYWKENRMEKIKKRGQYHRSSAEHHP